MVDPGKPVEGSKLAPDLSNWNKEDPEYWSSRRAWLTLWVSTYSMVIAFCVWFLVSVIAPRLNSIGFDLSASQLYWLTALPGLSGGLLRLVYMVLPPIVGTRRLVGYSSLLFVIPMLGWFFAVQDANTPYWWLLVLSFLCGIGGGSFSGYMPSTGYYFPKAKSGTALGIQAGVGNFGMSIIQLVDPWLMGFGLLGLGAMSPQRTSSGEDVFVYNAVIVFVPWAIVAAILAFTLLKDVPVKANIRQQFDIFKNPNTWYMTLMYVMTFGLFSGFAAQFGLLINNIYGSSSQFAGMEGLPQGVMYAFLGPLISSIIRILWGPLCDRFGGAIWTFISIVGMTVSLFAVTFFLRPDSPAEFTGFLWGMIAMFVFSGMGNAGTFKQMPMIMPARQSGGAIGFTAAIAAFGPFFVGISLTVMSPYTWFMICVVYGVICAIICWIRYARPVAPFPG